MPISNIDTVDDEELMKELDDIVEAEKPSRGKQSVKDHVRVGKRILDMEMPEIPLDNPSNTNNFQDNQDSLEKRWKKLRSNLTTA